MHWYIKCEQNVDRVSITKSTHHTTRYIETQTEKNQLEHTVNIVWNNHYGIFGWLYVFLSISISSMVQAFMYLFCSPLHIYTIQVCISIFRLFKLERKNCRLYNIIDTSGSKQRQQKNVCDDENFCAEYICCYSTTIRATSSSTSTSFSSNFFSFAM